MENIFNIANRIDSDFTYPTSKHTILKLIDTKLKLTYYSKCEKCKAYQKVMENARMLRCSSCNHTSLFNKENCFVYLDLSTQIRNEVEKNWRDIYSYYQEIHRNRNSGDGKMNDVFSSQLFQLHFRCHSV